MKNFINPQNMNLKKGTLLFLLLTCLAYTTLAQTDYTLQGSDVDEELDGDGNSFWDSLITPTNDVLYRTGLVQYILYNKDNPDVNQTEKYKRLAKEYYDRLDKKQIENEKENRFDFLDQIKAFEEPEEEPKLPRPDKFRKEEEQKEADSELKIELPK